MDLDNLTKKIINILFLNSEEMSIKELSSILELGQNSKIIYDNIKNITSALSLAGLKLIFNNDKLSISTSPEFSDILKSFTKHLSDTDLTPAQLQTLTIIAYLENVSVSQISFIRGVQSVQTVRALSTRGLIEKESKNNKINNQQEEIIESKGSKKDSQENIERRDNYILSAESLKYMGINNNKDLKDFDIIKNKLKLKLEEALNG